LAQPQDKALAERLISVNAHTAEDPRAVINQK
jgi:hypothetical protein